MKSQIVTLLALGALALAGCAGRAANPVTVVRVSDEQMSCKTIKAEIYQNNLEITRIGNERKWKLAQNIGAGVGAIIFFPAALLMDLQGTQSIEINALNDRQHRLADLAAVACK